MNKTIITSSDVETQALGKQFAKELKPGDVVCLYGDLGAGKTTFVKGVSKGLGVKTRIISPTFVVVRTHTVPDKSSGIKTLYHIDLYRLQTEGEVTGINLKDLLSEKDAVTLIEWPERAEHFAYHATWNVMFQQTEDGKRRKIIIQK